MKELSLMNTNDIIYVFNRIFSVYNPSNMNNILLADLTRTDRTIHSIFSFHYLNKNGAVIINKDDNPEYFL
jgi:hypothetical protein